MPLISCVDCGKHVSDKAISCPNCGCPIASTLKNSQLSILSSKPFKFEPDKSINYGNGKLLIDSKNKTFGIKRMFKTDTYYFDDLIDYELYEDGSSITKGKGLATAVGGATFGLLGALVGASGKRKSKPTCISMGINIYLNSYNSPRENIQLIASETNKSSATYSNAQRIANDIIANLQYIDNNK